MSLRPPPHPFISTSDIKTFCPFGRNIAFRHGKMQRHPMHKTLISACTGSHAVRWTDAHTDRPTDRRTCVVWPAEDGFVSTKKRRTIRGYWDRSIETKGKGVLLGETVSAERDYVSVGQRREKDFMFHNYNDDDDGDCNTRDSISVGKIEFLVLSFQK